MKKSIKLALMILIAILVVIIGTSSILSFLNRPMNRDDNTYKIVTIEEGSSTAQIADTLQEEEIIDGTTSYKILSKLWRYDGKYKSGQYSLSPSMSKSDIAKTIISGISAGTMVTIPEGYTINEVADTLAEQGLVDRDDFIETLHSDVFDAQFPFLQDAQKGNNHLEGYLTPETYSIPKDATSEEIITMMLSQFDSIFTEEDKKKAEELGYTPNEIVIIASLIEREAQVDEDRATIASVIYNRLDKGMKLQIDATIQYVLGGHKETVTIADTKMDSPYNTYLNDGLPPGPICSPGRESIEAALNPEKTDYLYYVVSEKLDGTHNFSTNYEDFQKDVQAYSDALAKQEEE